MKREVSRKFFASKIPNITVPLHILMVLIILAGFLLVRPLGAADCTNTSMGLIPLNDLAGGSYQGFPGGLYPGGNEVPASHLQVGLAAGQSVIPLDQQGIENPNGRIVVLSIGMSNTKIEFGEFASLLRRQNVPGVVLINGADIRQDAQVISDPAAPYWAEIDLELANRNLSPLQVQVVWLKEAVMEENRPFPADALALQGYLRDIVVILSDRYPNLKTIYFSSRTYAGYSTNELSQETWAYQGGFAVKWLIEGQINGNDPALAYENAPWLAWGPYLWADGETPRSDGLTWACTDFEADGVHPSEEGSVKVANMLFDFFSTDPTTSWFRPSEMPTPTATSETPRPVTPTSVPTATPTGRAGTPTPTDAAATPSPTATATFTFTPTPSPTAGATQTATSQPLPTETATPRSQTPIPPEPTNTPTRMPRPTQLPTRPGH